MGLIFLAIFAVVLITSFLWGLVRGVAKMRMRVASILLSFVLALVTTGVAKNLISGEWFVTGVIVPLLDQLEVTVVGDLIGMSETLNEVLLGCIGALLAPLLFVVFFLIWSLITWIVFAIVSLFLHGLMKEHNARLHFRALRILAWSALQALIVLLVVLVPVSVYTGIAPIVADDLKDAGIIDGNVNGYVEDYVDPIAESGAVKTFNAMGGKAICTSLTSFDVRGEKTTLENEASAVTSFACSIYRLSQTEFAKYSSKEAAVILAVADSFDRSELLPTIVGEVVYNAAEKWLAGQDFLGIEKPDAGELFNPFLDTLLDVFMQDAKNTDALQKDIRTLAEMVSTLARHEIFAHLSNPDELIAKLDGAGAINDLVTCLGKNESMKVLIPEITNLGIRAIAGTLGIPADEVEIYDTFMGDVAAKLNNLKEMSDEAQRTEALNAELKNAFDKAGLEVEEELIACYSASMMNDLLNNADGDIAAEDVRAFFILYAMNAEEEKKQQGEVQSDPVSATGINKELLAGTIYEHMTEEQLAKTGAATLAKVTVSLSVITGANEDEIAAKATEIIVSTYAEILGSDSPEVSILAEIRITEAISDKVIAATSSLQSSEEMGKTTTRVTVSDLVVVSKEVAQNINEGNLQKEVDVIKSVLSAAGNVLDMDAEGDNIDIKAIAGSVGQVMDALNDAGSFGKDQTSALFTAVIQSETVREAADLDMKTATELATKATEGEGDVNYTATMNSVSTSITIVTQMGKGEEIKDEDLVDMIRNLTPASAAMIEVYVSADRMIGYGVPEKSAPHSSAMISSVFSYLAHEKIDDFDAEAAALNRILDIAMAAKDNNDGKKLFGDILPSADECVSTLMKSKAIQHSLKVNMTDGEKVTVMDPYDFGPRLEKGEGEKQEFLDALDKYHAEHPETDPLVLEALAANFGIVVEYK